MSDLLTKRSRDLKYFPGIAHLNTAHTWRGGEQQVLYLASLIQKHGGRQIVIGQPNSELEKKCAENSIPFRAVKIRGEWDILSAGRIVKIIKENKISLLHTHTARAHAVGLMVKKRCPEICLVVSRRVDFPVSGNFFSRRKYLTPLVDRYLAISENVRQVLIEGHVPASRIRIAYSGIDLSRFSKMPDPSYLRKEFRIRPGDIVAGNVAALTDHKDQKTLLDAFSLVRKKKPANEKIRLFILGEGELRESLLAQTRLLGLENAVVFTGFRTDVLSFLSLFDIFVMSSKEEGLGTSVLDAMASGLPVVATCGGGIPEMIDHGQGGLLCNVGDAAGLGDGIDKLADSAQLRKKYAKYNLQKVKKFSCESTFHSTIEAYAELLDKK